MSELITFNIFSWNCERAITKISKWIKSVKWDNRWLI
jgi:hypothetical protein